MQLFPLNQLSKPVFVLMLIVAVVAVAMADVCLKRAALPGSLGQALRSPWMLAAVALYLMQVLLFAIVFVNGWDLSVVGAVQIALYAAVTLGAGVLLFDEVLSLKQALGAGFALIGVVLLSF